ncbi:hypothetical protein CHS0354_028301 [Potamilus streckersoni]|uniref:RNA helicase n=1 Tax=Potamilus streckersoni TaxID=2493646 RepID=A0AAE0RTY2_9BIVA|nr:hypothetical protein CHS0354_028301 [Potamilus streckersoni]
MTRKMEEKHKKDKKKKKSKKEKKRISNGYHQEKRSKSSAVQETKQALADGEEDQDVKTEKKMAPKPDLHRHEIEGAFSNFDLSESTVKKLQAQGIMFLFPVQYLTFNHVMNGEDVVAQARTGTGKTLSFALPIVECLQRQTKSKERGRPPSVLVLTPTRELAKQVAEDFDEINATLDITSVYGGSPYGPQEKAIYNGLDVLVGTPGRIWDLMDKGTLDLSKLKHVVLDEVDTMLDMGFADIVDKIINAAYQRADSKKPQTMLYSATMPPWVYQTARKYLRENVKKINLIGEQSVKTSKTVTHMALQCSYFDRAATIGDVIQVYSGAHGRAMVFCDTKRECDELVACSHIKQDAHILHGDVPQAKREIVMKGFKEGKYKVLVTTDVAARGLDIADVDLVIQCNPPKDVDSFIHRSGRTGRAGKAGINIVFYKPNEESQLQTVENLSKIKFKRVGPPSTDEIIKSSATDAAKSLDSVPQETLEHFRQEAEALVEQRGAVEALSAALAVISGVTKVASRSLLTSREGYTTYVFRTNMELHGLGYVWRAMERNLGMEDKEKITGMRLCKDKLGAVFDVPSDLVSTLDEIWKDGKYDSLEKATQLPELLEFERNDSWNNNTNRNRGAWGRGYGFQRTGYQEPQSHKRFSDNDNSYDSQNKNRKTWYDEADQ